MDRIRFNQIVLEARNNFSKEIEEKKGMRFYDNDRVLKSARMFYYSQQDVLQLPSVAHFLASVDEVWVKKNIPKVLKELSEMDFHYENLEKWTM